MGRKSDKTDTVPFTQFNKSLRNKVIYIEMEQQFHLLFQLCYVAFEKVLLVNSIASHRCFDLISKVLSQQNR